MEIPKNNGIIKSFSSSFNDAARQPTRLFEQQTGLTGIAANYVFPHPFTAAEYEDRYVWLFAADGFKHIPTVLTGTGLPEETMLSPDRRCGIYEFLQERSSGYKDLLHAGWRDLERLNPETAQLVFDRNDIHQTYDALLGVTSGYNINDINFFLDLKRQGVAPGMHAQTLPGYKDIHWNIECMTNTRMQWVASMPTMEKIAKLLSNRR